MQLTNILRHVYDERVDRALCKTSCSVTELSVRKTKMAGNVRLLARNRSENSTALIVRYWTSTVRMEERYKLVDFASVLSATGGALGLFLGFSCYGMASEMGGMLWRAMSHKN